MTSRALVSFCRCFNLTVLHHARIFHSQSGTSLQQPHHLFPDLQPPVNECFVVVFTSRIWKEINQGARINLGEIAVLFVTSQKVWSKSIEVKDGSFLTHFLVQFWTILDILKLLLHMWTFAKLNTFHLFFFWLQLTVIFMASSAV